MPRQRQNANIEDVLEYLGAENPVAVLLGNPGSGKSTILRWLALQMATAYYVAVYQRWFNNISHFVSVGLFHKPFSVGYQLPEGLAPRQIPILLHASDFAKHLSNTEAGFISFDEFLKEHITKKYPQMLNLGDRLLLELQQGHCLLLFDGLDEVANNYLRRRIAENISQFIADYSPKKSGARQYNRFIVTSRIVGYEAGSFSKFAHYTLLELEDEQVEEFLTHWCTTVERYQMSFAQGMRVLTTRQKAWADREGLEQRNRLLEALKRSPGIRRLVGNPLMLTILALIQRSGQRLPYRRFDLYQVVTRTLLDNWNQESGRKLFSSEEVALAEQLLSNLVLLC